MKNALLLLFAPLLFIGCSKDARFELPDDPLEVVQTTPEVYALGAQKQVFKVRIETLAEGDFVTPFAPGVWVVQKKNSAPIFTDGAPDYGDGLEAIAEDGAPGMLYDALIHHPKVREHGIFNTPVGAAEPAPIFPGEAYEFTFTAKPNDCLNFTTMFIQSNDLFVAPAPEGLSLFDENDDPISGDITPYLYLWDAGTEVNEEPGVGPNQAPRQSGPNTGPDENGVVQRVDDGYMYPALNEVIRVTVIPL
ncbi:MAG: spondin domain-containing protein [Phaeodactylibacter sp.]|nr:spondin domain-containing protein [Phaeodactylibacter sp.]